MLRRNSPIHQIWRLGKYFYFIIDWSFYKLSLFIGRMEVYVRACVSSHPLVERYIWTVGIFM